VLVAATLLLVLLPLIPMGLSHLKERRNIIACANNLRLFAVALGNYSDHHEGALPKVEEVPPFNVAGVFVPALNQDRVLGSGVSVSCPAKGLAQPPRQVSLHDLAMEHERDRERFERLTLDLAGCYAYSLGYRGPDGRHYGLRFRADESEKDHIAVMADRPPFQDQRERPSLTANSINHGGKGQNVLFLSGRVGFFTSRNVGVEGDDIYLNRNNVSAAGLDRFDAVLAPGNFQPYPFSPPLPK
jgi:hypothetical protein